MSEKTQGQPKQCRLDIKKGSGSKKEERWGFNKKTKKCEQFTFLGKGGNENNFLDENTCKKICLKKNPKDTDTLKKNVKGADKLAKCLKGGRFLNRVIRRNVARCLGNKKKNSRQCISDLLADMEFWEKMAYDTCELEEKSSCRSSISYYVRETKLRITNCNNKKNKARQERCWDRFGPRRIRYFGKVLDKCGGSSTKKTKAGDKIAKQQLSQQPKERRRRPARCYLPKAEGKGKYNEKRYYYNKQTGKCHSFIFKGKRGNKNNFDNKDACQDTCKTNLKPRQKRPSFKRSRQALCYLPIARGDGAERKSKWAFDKKSKRCVEFTWTGGKNGNNNRFSTEKECATACKKKAPRGQQTSQQQKKVSTKRNRLAECYLPIVPGPCKAKQTRWGFSSQEGTCVKFTYGGCKGNANRFNNYVECKNRCAKRKSLSSKKKQTKVKPIPQRCFKEPKTGSGKARITRYYYDAKSKECKSFTFGGVAVKGLQNNFETKKECKDTCRKRVIGITGSQKQEKGQTSSKKLKEQRDATGEKGGEKKAPSGSNTDKGGKTKKEQKPQEKIVNGRPARCYFPAKEGGKSCSAAIPSFYYDAQRTACRFFVYKGCGGNRNRFVSKAHCEAVCRQRDDVKKVSEPSGKRPAKCFLEPARGPGTQVIKRYFYVKASNSCMQFVYGGVKGNGNNFASQSECESTCKKSTKPKKQVKPQPQECSEPPKKGNCTASISRYFFHKESGNCHKFVYSGCNGNKNRFETYKACMSKCSTTGEYKPKYVYKYVTKKECIKRQNPSGKCIQRKEIRKKVKFVEKWKKQKRCVKHEMKEVNCDILKKRKDEKLRRQVLQCRNTPKGPDRDACWKKHKKSKRELTTITREQCARLGKDKTMKVKICSQREIVMVRSLVEASEQGSNIKNKLKKTPKPRSKLCYLPPKKGPCEKSVERWHYSHKQGKCVKFTYGGCKGNLNNFKTKILCEAECRRTKLKLNGQSNKVVADRSFCKLTPTQNKCKVPSKRFFFNAKEGKCVPFPKPACAGNANNFGSYKSCYQSCQKSLKVPKWVSKRVWRPKRCHAPQKVGPCKASVTRYHYDPTKQKCVQFSWGGCQPNGNNFKTLEQCQQICRVKAGPLLNPQACFAAKKAYKEHDKRGEKKCEKITSKKERKECRQAHKVESGKKYVQVLEACKRKTKKTVEGPGQPAFRRSCVQWDSSSGVRKCSKYKKVPVSKSICTKWTVSKGKKKCVEHSLRVKGAYTKVSKRRCVSWKKFQGKRKCFKWVKHVSLIPKLELWQLKCNREKKVYGVRVENELQHCHSKPTHKKRSRCIRKLKRKEKHWYVSVHKACTPPKPPKKPKSHWFATWDGKCARERKVYRVRVKDKAKECKQMEGTKRADCYGKLVKDSNKWAKGVRTTCVEETKKRCSQATVFYKRHAKKRRKQCKKDFCTKGNCSKKYWSCKANVRVWKKTGIHKACGGKKEPKLLQKKGIKCFEWKFDGTNFFCAKASKKQCTRFVEKKVNGKTKKECVRYTERVTPTKKQKPISKCDSAKGWFANEMDKENKDCQKRLRNKDVSNCYLAIRKKQNELYRHVHRACLPPKPTEKKPKKSGKVSSDWRPERGPLSVACLKAKAQFHKTVEQTRDQCKGLTGKKQKECESNVQEKLSDLKRGMAYPCKAAQAKTEEADKTKNPDDKKSQDQKNTDLSSCRSAHTEFRKRYNKYTKFCPILKKAQRDGCYESRRLLKKKWKRDEKALCKGYRFVYRRVCVRRQTSDKGKKTCVERKRTLVLRKVKGQQSSSAPGMFKTVHTKVCVSHGTILVRGKPEKYCKQYKFVASKKFFKITCHTAPRFYKKVMWRYRRRKCYADGQTKPDAKCMERSAKWYQTKVDQACWWKVHLRRRCNRAKEKYSSARKAKIIAKRCEDQKSGDAYRQCVDTVNKWVSKRIADACTTSCTKARKLQKWQASRIQKCAAEKDDKEACYRKRRRVAAFYRKRANSICSASKQKEVLARSRQIAKEKRQQRRCHRAARRAEYKLEQFKKGCVVEQDSMAREYCWNQVKNYKESLRGSLATVCGGKVPSFTKKSEHQPPKARTLQWWEKLAGSCGSQRAQMLRIYLHYKGRCIKKEKASDRQKCLKWLYRYSRVWRRQTITKCRTYAQSKGITVPQEELQSEPRPDKAKKDNLQCIKYKKNPSGDRECVLYGQKQTADSRKCIQRNDQNKCVKWNKPAGQQSQSQSVCTLKPQKGPCKAKKTRFFYNPTSKKCEKFTFSGCGGNGNNFRSRKQCLSNCGTGDAKLNLCQKAKINFYLKSREKRTDCLQLTGKKKKSCFKKYLQFKVEERRNMVHACRNNAYFVFRQKLRLQRDKAREERLTKEAKQEKKRRDEILRNRKTRDADRKKREDRRTESLSRARKDRQSRWASSDEKRTKRHTQWLRMDVLEERNKAMDDFWANKRKAITAAKKRRNDQIDELKSSFDKKTKTLARKEAQRQEKHKNTIKAFWSDRKSKQRERADKRKRRFKKLLKDIKSKSRREVMWQRFNLDEAALKDEEKEWDGEIKLAFNRQETRRQEAWVRRMKRRKDRFERNLARLTARKALYNTAYQNWETDVASIVKARKSWATIASKTKRLEAANNFLKETWKKADERRTALRKDIEKRWDSEEQSRAKRLELEQKEREARRKQLDDEDAEVAKNLKEARSKRQKANSDRIKKLMENINKWKAKLQSENKDLKAKHEAREVNDKYVVEKKKVCTQREKVKDLCGAAKKDFTTKSKQLTAECESKGKKSERDECKKSLPTRVETLKAKMKDVCKKFGETKKGKCLKWTTIRVRSLRKWYGKYQTSARCRDLTQKYKGLLKTVRARCNSIHNTKERRSKCWDEYKDMKSGFKASLPHACTAVKPEDKCALMQDWYRRRVQAHKDYCSRMKKGSEDRKQCDANREAKQTSWKKKKDETCKGSSVTLNDKVKELKRKLKEQREQASKQSSKKLKGLSGSADTQDAKTKALEARAKATLHKERNDATVKRIEDTQQAINDLKAELVKALKSSQNEKVAALNAALKRHNERLQKIKQLHKERLEKNLLAYFRKLDGIRKAHRTAVKKLDAARRGVAYSEAKNTLNKADSNTKAFAQKENIENRAAARSWAHAIRRFKLRAYRRKMKLWWAQRREALRKNRKNFRKCMRKQKCRRNYFKNRMILLQKKWRMEDSAENARFEAKLRSWRIRKEENLRKFQTLERKRRRRAERRMHWVATEQYNKAIALLKQRKLQSAVEQKRFAQMQQQLQAQEFGAKDARAKKEEEVRLAHKKKEIAREAALRQKVAEHAKEIGEMDALRKKRWAELAELRKQWAQITDHKKYLAAVMEWNARAAKERQDLAATRARHAQLTAQANALRRRIEAAERRAAERKKQLKRIREAIARERARSIRAKERASKRAREAKHARQKDQMMIQKVRAAANRFDAKWAKLQERKQTKANKRNAQWQERLRRKSKALKRKVLKASAFKRSALQARFWRWVARAEAARTREKARNAAWFARVHALRQRRKRESNAEIWRLKWRARLRIATQRAQQEERNKSNEMRHKAVRNKKRLQKLRAQAVERTRRARRRKERAAKNDAREAEAKRREKYRAERAAKWDEWYQATLKLPVAKRREAIAAFKETRKKQHEAELERRKKQAADLKQQYKDWLKAEAIREQQRNKAEDQAQAARDKKRLDDEMLREKAREAQREAARRKEEHELLTEEANRKRKRELEQETYQRWLQNSIARLDKRFDRKRARWIKWRNDDIAVRKQWRTLKLENRKGSQRFWTAWAYTFRKHHIACKNAKAWYANKVKDSTDQCMKKGGMERANCMVGLEPIHKKWYGNVVRKTCHANTLRGRLGKVWKAEKARRTEWRKKLANVVSNLRKTVSAARKDARDKLKQYEQAKRVRAQEAANKDKQSADKYKAWMDKLKSKVAVIEAKYRAEQAAEKKRQAKAKALAAYRKTKEYKKIQAAKRAKAEAARQAKAAELEAQKKEADKRARAKAEADQALASYQSLMRQAQALRLAAASKHGKIPADIQAQIDAMESKARAAKTKALTMIDKHKAMMQKERERRKAESNAKNEEDQKHQERRKKAQAKAERLRKERRQRDKDLAARYEKEKKEAADKLAREATAKAKEAKAKQNRRAELAEKAEKAKAERKKRHAQELLAKRKRQQQQEQSEKAAEQKKKNDDAEAAKRIKAAQQKRKESLAQAKAEMEKRHKLRRQAEAQAKEGKKKALAKLEEDLSLTFVVFCCILVE